MAAVLLEQPQSNIYRLTVNRPEARNALNWDAQTQFAVAVETVAGDDAARALVVTGGEGAFISGGDVKELMAHPDREGGERLARGMTDTLNLLTNLPCITIALINGPARGGGAEVSLACDLRIMAVEASIAFVHASLGLIPGWGGLARLGRLIGESRALDLTASARVVYPDEALYLGLVNRVAPLAELETELAAFLALILANDANAVRTAKTLLLRGVDRPDAAEAEFQAFVDLWPREERIQRFSRFQRS
jgi:enoyl-CoA hydratase